MSLSVIPISMKAYVTATATSGDDTLYQLVFHKNTEDEEIIDGVVAIYTAEDLQIPALSTQRYYGVYFNPIIDGDNLIFKAAYGGYKYTAIIADDDTDILSGNTPMMFSNDEVEPRLLPVPTDEDVGKVPTVQEDGSYALETPEEGVQELDDLTDVVITEPTDGQILKYNSTSQKWENEDETEVIVNLSGLEDVDLTNLADGQIIKYDATSQKWINADIEGYDSEAHTINITNFTASNPNNATLSFNIDKFIKGNKSIAVINISGSGIEEHISGDEVECKPSSDATIYIANATPITFNSSLPKASGSWNFNFKVNGVTNYSFVQVRARNDYTYPNYVYAEHIGGTGTDAYTNGGWRNIGGNSTRNITLNAGQNLTMSVANWLIGVSDFTPPSLNKYEIRFKFITNNKYYSCVLIVYLNNGVWELQSKTITEISTIPDAPTTDGEYNLKATVSSGTPAYSWNEEVIPDAPSADGTYALQVTVASGTPTYSWVSTT